jgi:hypothetical protein
MSNLSDVCTLCKAEINSALTNPRPPAVTISPSQLVSGPCFVADEIVFTGTSRLIFDVNFQIGEYAVICRKLTISGGSKPFDLNPCNPGDPGTRYRTNVITWGGRLKSAVAGADVSPPSAPGSGNDDGMPGMNGVPGNPGQAGMDLGIGQEREKRPIKLVIVALQVEVINGGNLVIDWAGQDGGDGGKGQNGGKGNKGTKGNDGKDESWPSSGCDNGTGTGGEGGPGGAGGEGGPGGKGGGSGQLVIVSLPDLMASTGVFNDPSRITLVTLSNGGKGGPGGRGGDGGPGGNPGKPSSECGAGQPGIKGTSFVALAASQGAAGNPGAALTTQFEVIKAECATSLPAPLIFDSSNVLPHDIRRCFSGAATDTINLTGSYLDQLVAVGSNITGVTATIKPLASNDTQLVLDVTAAANSGSGLGDLVFTYLFPGASSTQKLAGAIRINVCTVTGISSSSGAQGTTVPNFTVTGTSFDLGAASHDIVVSGLGVNAVNVQVVDEQTMKCDLVIENNATKTQRSVTVKAGTCQHTLPNAFTVT